MRWLTKDLALLPDRRRKAAVTFVRHRIAAGNGPWLAAGRAMGWSNRSCTGPLLLRATMTALLGGNRAELSCACLETAGAAGKRRDLDAEVAMSANRRWRRQSRGRMAKSDLELAPGMPAVSSNSTRRPCSALAVRHAIEETEPAPLYRRHGPNFAGWAGRKRDARRVATGRPRPGQVELDQPSPDHRELMRFQRW